MSSTYYKRYYGYNKGYVYMITNTKNNKSYIGGSLRLPMIRWHEHFMKKSPGQYGIDKIKYKLSDWTFRILEEIELPKELRTRKERFFHIIFKEQYYIKKYNTIEKGYNIHPAKNGGEKNGK